MSENVSKCPRCGADLPSGSKAGPCPRCAARFLQATQTEALDEHTGPRPRFKPPQPGELASLFPQLEIIELVGQGGMGAVYKARQKELDRMVALKVLPPDIGHAPSFAERFAREAKALARLNHPGIVTLYEFGRAGGDAAPEAAPARPLYYFLMEFVNGLNLRQVLEAGRMSPREALAVVPQICDALQYAHDQGIVHRDIKPENILLDRQGRVKVADFGLAKLVGAVESAGDEMAAPPPARTGAGTVMGTPQYMAPEQREHPSDVDHRADIYSLGVVLYQMLTGELPAEGKVEAPSRKVSVDVRLDEVVLRALEKQPERRYQQASRVKEDVETIAGSTPPPGSAPALDARTKAQRRRLFQVKAACFFFSAVCFLVAAVSFFTRDESPLAAVLSLIAVYSFSIVGYRYIQAALALDRTPGAPGPGAPDEPRAPDGIATAPGERIRRKVRHEAIGLLVVGVLNWILIPLAVVAIRWSIPLVAVRWGLPLGWDAVELHLSNRALNAACVASLALSSFVIYAAVKMMRWEAYRTAVAGGIVAMLVPPGNVIGLPLGIWALVTLTRPDVRARFGPARGEHWLIPKWAMFLALGLLGAYAIRLGGRVLPLPDHSQRDAQPARIETVNQKLTGEVRSQLEAGGYACREARVAVHSPGFPGGDCTIVGLRRMAEGAEIPGGLNLRHDGSGTWFFKGWGALADMQFKVDAAPEMGLRKAVDRKIGQEKNHE